MLPQTTHPSTSREFPQDILLLDSTSLSVPPRGEGILDSSLNVFSMGDGQDMRSLTKMFPASQVPLWEFVLLEGVGALRLPNSPTPLGSASHASPSCGFFEFYLIKFPLYILCVKKIISLVPGCALPCVCSPLGTVRMDGIV